jgi:Cd(II)/Pb(II)-responsive transcriptional regulator
VGYAIPIKNAVVTTGSSVIQFNLPHQSKNMKIGALALQTDCQVETIRFYEQSGLLPSPARDESNYRVYGVHHLERLQFILHCRKLDMALDEIRLLLNFKDSPAALCTQVNHVLEAHLGHVSKRISELIALEKALKQLRAQCQTIDIAANCGILNELSSNHYKPNLASLASSEDTCAVSKTVHGLRGT